MGVSTNHLVTVSLVLVSWIQHGVALLCYNCSSTLHPGCGPYFKPTWVSAVTCEENATLCALQRQPAIREQRQVAGILRGCYIPGQMSGLNESDGCRYHSSEDGYSARYCFCSYDLCNSSTELASNWITLSVTLCVVVVVLLSRRPS